MTLSSLSAQAIECTYGALDAEDPSELVSRAAHTINTYTEKRENTRVSDDADEVVLSTSLLSQSSTFLPAASDLEANHECDRGLAISLCLLCILGGLGGGLLGGLEVLLKVNGEKTSKQAQANDR